MHRNWRVISCMYEELSIPKKGQFCRLSMMKDHHKQTKRMIRGKMFSRLGGDLLYSWQCQSSPLHMDCWIHTHPKWIIATIIITTTSIIILGVHGMLPLDSSLYHQHGDFHIFCDRPSISSLLKDDTLPPFNIYCNFHSAGAL